MKRLISLLVLLVGIAAYGQDYEEASVYLFEKGRTMMFVLQDEDHYLGMYFFPNTENREKAFVEVEMRDYTKTSELKDLIFKPEVSGSKIKLYAKDGTYIWHVMFHYDTAFVYNAKGEFLFKIPRHS